jgi:hypothetical protein
MGITARVSCAHSNFYELLLLRSSYGGTFAYFGTTEGDPPSSNPKEANCVMMDFCANVQLIGFGIML